MAASLACLKPSPAVETAAVSPVVVRLARLLLSTPAKSLPEGEEAAFPSRCPPAKAGFTVGRVSPCCRTGESPVAAAKAVKGGTTLTCQTASASAGRLSHFGGVGVGPTPTA